jgi:murein DD-endopeptidase MepM/ murein hydrolase activator NlpD
MTRHLLKIYSLNLILALLTVIGTCTLATSVGILNYPMRSGHSITSRFGVRIHPITGKNRQHNGLDIRGNIGDKVISAQSGKVINASYVDGFGRMVEVENNNSNLRTRYAHLSKILVTVGQEVKPGDLLGKVGSSGASTGPHLHFEVREIRDGRWTSIDPEPLLYAKNSKTPNKNRKSPLPSCKIAFIGDCEVDND